MMSNTVSETLRGFAWSGGDRMTDSGALRSVHPSRSYAYTDTTPPPDTICGSFDVAWSWDCTRGVNQHPDHCGKCSPNPWTGKKYDSPLDYRLRIGHASERDAIVWASVYTSGAGLLYSRGRLIAARQAIGGRDGRIAIMIRSVVGLDAVQRRHVAQLRKEISRQRARAWGNDAIVLTVGDDALIDHEQGPRWACTILCQDGGSESATVHAWNRDQAWDVLRQLCVSRMDDGVLRSPQSVAFRPTSASVDALAGFVTSRSEMPA